MWHISADELVAPAPCLHDQWLHAFSLNVVGPSHHQGFLCVFSVYYTPFSATSAFFLAMCDTVAPAAFIPMACHRWLMVLFPMTKSNWLVTKSWLLGWPKLCWFQLYCSKTIWSFSLIFASHVTRYMFIILTFFQEATQCLTLWKISLENFCKNFFPGVYVMYISFLVKWSISSVIKLYTESNYFELLLQFTYSLLLDI